MTPIKKIVFSIKNPDILIWFSKDFVDKNLRSTIGLCCFIYSHILRTFGIKKKSVEFLMFSHRVSNGKINLISNSIYKRKNAIFEYSRSVTKEARTSDQINLALGRCIILKEPEFNHSIVFEKGILLISFTESFPVLFANYNFTEISKVYHIVLEPSSAGYCLPEIMAWASLSEPVIVQATEIFDYKFLEGLNSNLVPIEIGASNWVDQSVFCPLARTEKKYDVLYVANYNRVKRHHIFFKALKRLKNYQVKAAMACSSYGKNRKTIEKLIEWYGVTDCLEIYEDLNKTELNLLINQSKCNLLLSLKEGSNRSVFESIFSGVPAIVLKNNVGLNKKYINEETGILSNDAALADDIMYLRKNHQNFSPEKWATLNISPRASIDLILRTIQILEANRAWGTNSVTYTKVNTPEVQYDTPPNVNFSVEQKLKEYRLF